MMELDHRKLFESALKYISHFQLEEKSIEKSQRDSIYKDYWKICLTVPVSVPGDSFFPKEVSITIYHGKQFPYSDYAVYTNSEKIQGYPHQNSLGKLCLRRNAIGYSEKKLWEIVRFTIDWLDNAASNKLDDVGQPYELPVFSCSNVSGFLFQESKETWHVWKSHLGKYGIFVFGIPSSNTKEVYVDEYFDVSLKSSILQYEWGTKVNKIEDYYHGLWVLLDREPTIINKRPCQIWGEFIDILKTNNISFRELYSKIPNDLRLLNGRYILFVGFPICEKYGDTPHEIHWQPFLANQIMSPRNYIIPGFRKGHAPRKLVAKYIEKIKKLVTTNIDWYESINIEASRLYGRGKLSTSIIERKITLIGLGAVGSIMAEYLSREGVKKILLFDSDLLEPGNLCRHTLCTKDVGSYKTESLAKHLSDISPLLKVNYHTKKLPLDLSSQECKDLLSSDIWINCTASEAATLWLDNLAQVNKKILVNLYITVGAKYLCMYGNGTKTCASNVHKSIMTMREDEHCPIPNDFFIPPDDSELIREGMGCWHPTFPARLNDITMLVSYALDRLNSKLIEGDVEKGWAMVAGKDGESGFGSKPNLKCYFEEYL